MSNLELRFVPIERSNISLEVCYCASSSSNRDICLQLRFVIVMTVGDEKSKHLQNWNLKFKSKAKSAHAAERFSAVLALDASGAI